MRRFIISRLYSQGCTLFANSAALMCLNTGTPGKHLFPIYDTQKINGLGVSILKNIGLTFILDKST